MAWTRVPHHRRVASQCRPSPPARPSALRGDTESADTHAEMGALFSSFAHFAAVTPNFFEPGGDGDRTQKYSKNNNKINQVCIQLSTPSPKIPFSFNYLFVLFLRGGKHVRAILAHCGANKAPISTRIWGPTG